MHRSRQARDQAGSEKGLARAGPQLGGIGLLEVGEAFAAMARKRRRQFNSRV
jgi:acetyl-CoA acetyltransferase